MLANGQLLLLLKSKTTDTLAISEDANRSERVGIAFAFSEPDIRQIQYHLRAILSEMDTARPEEFF
jgi:hypothetical protein